MCMLLLGESISVVLLYNGLTSTAIIFREAALSRGLDSIALEKKTSKELGEAKRDSRALPVVCLLVPAPQCAATASRELILSILKMSYKIA